ncbi:hypothetical protein [Streptomyces sp. NPDC058812]|uniref:hypothetical protein n=1 Tax=unclassified Streptomyces TaxID=2593676 RepID=UPI0036809065
MAHYTPKHASWLNQVEIFFSLLARAVLRHGDFSSRVDLLGKVTDFTIVHNATARPFRWNYEGRPRQTGAESATAAYRTIPGQGSAGTPVTVISPPSNTPSKPRPWNRGDTW